jgi:hypothetical protein
VPWRLGGYFRSSISKPDHVTGLKEKTLSKLIIFSRIHCGIPLGIDRIPIVFVVEGTVAKINNCAGD